MVCSLARQTFFEYKKTGSQDYTRCAGIHACPYDCLRGQGLGHKSVGSWYVCVHGMVTREVWVRDTESREVRICTCMCAWCAPERSGPGTQRWGGVCTVWSPERSGSGTQRVGEVYVQYGHLRGLGQGHREWGGVCTVWSPERSGPGTQRVGRCMYSMVT